MKPQELGAAAETRVLNLLIRKGWHLLDRNWSCRWGEFDLLVIKDRQLLLVEVKGRRSPSWSPSRSAGQTTAPGANDQLLAKTASPADGLPAAGGRRNRSTAPSSRTGALVPVGATVLMHSEAMGFHGHQTRKRFGQHWLKDQSVLDRIVAAADLQQQDRVLEVGPGRGALTERLLASPAGAVHAVELDRDLVGGLKERFGGEPRFSLRQGDVLELPLLLEDGAPAGKVVANIPYNITGPLLERLIGRLDRPVDPAYQTLVLLVQKEVAERIRARPGHSSFSALSVRMQLLAHCHSVCPVPPRCFQPPPKVQSEVIQLNPLSAEERLEPLLARRVELLLKQAFLARRKMLRNTLGSLMPETQLQQLAAEAGVNLQQRPQELAPQTWVALARGLNQFD